MIPTVGLHSDTRRARSPLSCATLLQTQATARSEVIGVGVRGETMEGPQECGSVFHTDERSNP